MRQIGVRELKASLSEMLRLAGRGERIRVTVHGRPVADIVPAGSDTGAAGAASDERLRELVAERRLTPPTRPRPARSPRLVRAPRPASALVLDDRDAER